MIVAASLKADLADAGRYLEYGKNGREEAAPERVAWTARHGVFGGTREQIIEEMEVVAAMSARVEKPGYHLKLSWHPEDAPTKEEMKASAKRALRVLGLGEHQAWIVAHGDTAAPHVHVLANRVHPVTGEVWSRWGDVEKRWAIARDLEREYGWRQAGPERLGEVWSDRFTPQRAAWEAGEEGRARSLRVVMRERAKGHLAEARGWADLEARLSTVAPDGLRLEARHGARGMVVGLGLEVPRTERERAKEYYVALSSISRSHSRPKLEAGFGQTWAAYQEEKLGQRPALIYDEAKGESPREMAQASTSARAASGGGGFTSAEIAAFGGGDGQWHGGDQRGERAAFEVPPPEKPTIIARHQPTGTSDMETKDPRTSSKRISSEREASRRNASAATSSPAEQEARAAAPTEEQRALTFAQHYYRQALEHEKDGERARTFLKERGLPERALAADGVGFAPDRWQGLVRAAREEGISGEVLERAGLAHEKRDRSGHIDRFRGRVTFPVTNEAGEIAGFGARRVEGLERETPALTGNPKYINSPDSAYYDKGAMVYGLAPAREAVERQAAEGKERRVLVVEGYTDAVQARDRGAREVVALGGTSLGRGQAEQLTRLVREGGRVDLMLDGDAAGRLGTQAAVGKLVEAGATPHVARLPEGEDPDSFARRLGPDPFEAWRAANTRHFAEDLLQGETHAGAFGHAEAQREAVRLAAAAPTAALAERHFERAFEASLTPEATDSARHYRYKALEAEFEQALAGNGLARVPAEERKALAPRTEEMERLSGLYDRHGYEAVHEALSDAKQTPPDTGIERGGGAGDLVGRAAARLGEPVHAERTVEAPASETRTLAEALLRSEWASEAVRGAEQAFEQELRRFYVDGDRAVAAWRSNERRHGEQLGYGSVIMAHQFGEGYEDPGAPKAQHLGSLRTELLRAARALDEAREGQAAERAGAEAAFDGLSRRKRTEPGQRPEPDRPQEPDPRRERYGRTQERSLSGAEAVSAGTAGAERADRSAQNASLGGSAGLEGRSGGVRSGDAGAEESVRRVVRGAAGVGGGEDVLGRADERGERAGAGRAAGRTGEAAGGRESGREGGLERKHRGDGAPRERRAEEPERGRAGSDGRVAESGQGREGSGAEPHPGGAEEPARSRSGSRRDEPAGARESDGRAEGRAERAAEGAARDRGAELGASGGADGSGDHRRPGGGAADALGDGAVRRPSVDGLSAGTNQAESSRPPLPEVKEVGEKVQEKARAAAESPALNQKENPGQKEFPERVIAGSSSEQEKALPVAASYPTRSGGEVRHDSPEEAARAERGMKTPGVLAEQAQGQQPALEERVEAAREQRDVARLWAGPQVEVRRAAAERAEAALKAGLSPTGTSEAALHRVAIAARDRFTERLGEVYRDPVAAREAFNEAVRTRGFAEALETLHSQPEKLGRLKGAAVLGYETGQRQHARSEAEALHTYAANAVAHEAASYRLRVAQLLQANRAAQVERLGRANGGRLEQLGRVYRDPEAALAAFDRAAGRALPGTGRMPNADFAAAMKVLAERPEAYGELRGGYAGWAEVEDLDRVAARKVAASSGRPGSDLEKALREGQTARAYVALATAPGVEADRVMERYRAEYEGVRARLEALPKKEHAQDLLQGALATSGPEARRRAGAEAERLGQAVQDVGAGEERLAAARQEGRARSARVDEAFGRLHANPVQAREAYEKAAGLDPKAERYERASAHLQVEPQAYGTLKDGLQSQAKEQSREATDMHKAYAEKVKESGQALGSLKEARAAFQKAAGVITDGGKLGRELDEKGLRQTVVNYNMEKGEQAVQTAATLRGGPLGRVASNLARRATQEMRQAAGVDRDI